MEALTQVLLAGFVTVGLPILVFDAILIWAIRNESRRLGIMKRQGRMQ